ncbi:hypothetical protein M406DRAFT_272779 [Cryphonectria parasitica EP155]|uniref:Lid2 complex component lid2 n=1 Tax=Cryphonectria parasitica (strain ATCC 38755 / EP155) TaxID=660469 RepID=A0A9P4YEK9_CRYP1|nr:uncharacterized protein M406DRAFT_272779 [Cryphonectria parasitica EP155]KAF3771344.1 hypothetical protein M406DRAFT_272779 [Cryphonectria parasitica EP155]
MTSLPLDLTSVERRGQPTAVKEPLKKTSRIYDLEEAPVYQPTEEEWKDPIEYIRKITPDAEKFGICKVIPPDSWDPDFAIDTEVSNYARPFLPFLPKFHFRTRKQDLNSVEGSESPFSPIRRNPSAAAAKRSEPAIGSRANITYVDALLKFHKQNGNQLTRMPYVDKRPLDLYRLKKAVESRGGFDKVCRTKKWAEIGRDLGYSGKIMSSLSTSLKNSYQKWLCPYEDFLRLAKPGVHQQLEWENGGPLTPSPAPSPMKHSNVNTPSSLRGDSPARNASSALQASVNSGRCTPAADAQQPPPPPKPVTSGFTAINSGGFTAVNSGFTSVNRPVVQDSKTSTPSKQFASPLASAKNTPEYRPSGLGPSASALKRQLSTDSLDLSRDNAVPTVAGSHMSMFRPMPRLPRDDTSLQKCAQCGKAEESSFFAVCESCDNAYHGTCLDPPLKVKPEPDWNCPRCLVGDGQFGFEEGGLYSLRQFQEKAADFKQGYFEKKMSFDAALGCNKPITEDTVEREFWRLVTDVDEEVQVEYGADIHCTTHGSGFPTIEKHPTNPYSTDPWNLNVLPYHQDSLFRHIKSDISGMTVPWVYVGMTFSTFCWHNEDHYAYSANYQHFGATKTWYGIPAEDTEKFEQAMKDAVPELFETNPDLLFQLVTLLTPDQLKKAGVRVFAADQRAGQFVITFPKAYHAGFNHGFNFNEAVNFAPCDWEPFGLDGVERLQAYRRQPCFSHDELLWTAAEGMTGNGLTIQTAKWLAPALERIHRRELAERDAFRHKHCSLQSHQCNFGIEGEMTCPLAFKVDDKDVPEEEYSCAYCKGFAYLSRFKCLKSGKVYCLLHAGSQPCCEVPEAQRFYGKDHELVYRRTDEAISATGKKVSEKASVPEIWEEKYDKVLEEEPTPSLKTLRNLLNEGERIPYELKTLPILRNFVDRCNRWVEEATNYTIRKQQNRRKNEKVWQAGLRKSSIAQQDEREREMRKLSNIYRLVDEADKIGFECPEIQLIKDRSNAIKAFQESARKVIDHPSMHQVEAVEELLEEGNNFNVDLDEMDKLAKVLDKLKWNQRAKESRCTFMSFTEVTELIDEAKRIGIESYNDHLAYYVEQLTQGFVWEKKAKEIMESDAIHYQQLEALSLQATQHLLPVSLTTLEQVDQILHKHREALRLIVDLNTRSRMHDNRKRPKYAELAEVMKMLDDLQSKPAGTLDLEKEQRRHEDWMRKGKKLFGKTNAPLHILKSHMEAVLERNVDCFDISRDKPRLPAEPASREPSPDKEKAGGVYRWDDPKFREVFCICRRVEAGMMIECELCHEWYHGKCLKIARGKVKEEDKYTCPICDWRVKIPRDAARPKLEDLIDWYDEIPGLPFQPEEEDLLKKIIDNAQAFRNHVSSYCNPVLSTRNEAETQRFYLRKIEGAEVLLADETNFFRQELHKWSPVAPDPPPIIEVSKSTRKPRPTKLDRLLLAHGVTDVEDLPEAVKSKGLSLKRKRQNAEMAAQAAAQHAVQAGSSTGAQANSPPSALTYASYYQRGTSSQPQTPNLSTTSSSHAHPPRGPGSAGSIHPSFFHHTLPSGPQLLRTPVDDGGALSNYMFSEASRQTTLEYLSRTSEGRKKAEEIFGPNPFNQLAGPAMSSAGGQDDAFNGSVDDGDVDQMFADMVNQDEDDEKGKGVASQHSDQEKITADSLDRERNGIDALLDGD